MDAWLVGTLFLATTATACGSVRPEASSPGAPSPVPSPGALPAALYGGSDTDGTVIDERHAIAAVEAMWPLRERALHSRDVATLGRLETGVVLAADIGQVCYGGCPLPDIRAARFAAAVVQRQNSFPAAFLGSVDTTYRKDSSQGFLETMVFTRSDRQSPWLLTLEDGYLIPTDRPVRYVAMREDSNGNSEPFATAPPSRAGVDVSKLSSELAADWQSWADHGVASPTSRFRAETGAWLPGYESQSKANGLSEHFTFGADPAIKLYQFAIYPTNDLACTVIDYTDTLAYVASGLLMHQPADRSNWGGAIAPGDYQEITYQGVVQVCFVIQPSPAEVIAMDTGLWVTAATGKLPA